MPSMLFDSLSDSLSSTVRKLRGVDKITEKNVTEAMKDVKRALLDADVNLRVVNALLKEIKARAIGAEVAKGVEPGQMLVNIMYEELKRVMGENQAPLARRTDKRPTVILLAGLQGAGKTTAAAKLALYCLNEKDDTDKPTERSVLMVAADVYRPAAIDQLQTLGTSIGVEVFSRGTEVDPRDIVRDGIARAEELGVNTVIVDTAGRQVVEDKLMKELEDIKKISEADEVLLVVDAMTGQEAATVTRAFNDAVGLTGAILTKMDGDTRGGAALSVQRVSGAPIKFLGVGEKVERLEAFYPERMASRILGMGDVVSLVEKAKEQMNEEEAKRMTEKMMSAEFDFNDFLKQTKMMNRMGSMAGMLKMMPGMSGMGGLSPDKLAQAENKLKVADSMIKSMTKQERANPELLSSSPTARSRLRRIAKGSGRTDTQARDLVKDFGRMRKVMQSMSQRMMGGMGGEGTPEDAVEAGMAMGGGMPGGAGPPPSGGGNRSARRKTGKKKASKGPPKRGFG